MKNATDEETLQLIEAAHRFDADAMEKLVIKYKALVCKIARGYYLVRGGDTDDLIQEGTVGFLKAVREFSADKNRAFLPYASMCIHCRIRDALRTAKRDKNRCINDAVSMQSDESAMEAEADQDVIDTFINREISLSFRDAAKEILNDTQLRILNMYLEGYSYREIAERANVSVKTVDNTMASVRARIKKNEARFRALIEQ